jgi:hypothetical protein
MTAYFHARAIEERELARGSLNHAVRIAHLRLADAFERKAGQRETGAGARRLNLGRASATSGACTPPKWASSPM